MFKIVSCACAALMAVSVPVAAPAMAMPVATPAWHSQTDVTQADFHRRRDWRNERSWQRERDWRRQQQLQQRHSSFPEVYRDGDIYLRGHRGYREYRPGYRRHGEFWFPPAAFIAGAIIGGAIANQPPTVRYRQGGDPHVEWCYARYRSYRATDNTFQPYNGPRRQCLSPYG